jgi:hypothetical protein
MGYALKRAVRAAFDTPGEPRARLMAIGGASALLGTLVCGMADFIWFYPRVMLIFWFVFALVLCAVKLQTQGKHKMGKANHERT